MTLPQRLTPAQVALVICFTALYAVFASIPIFQILGVPGRNISAAAISAPIIGMVLGPYLGMLSATLGGALSFFVGSFFPPSYVSGIVATTCAGLLRSGKRAWCALIYVLFLFAFGLYPSIGPFWLFPLSTWFQIAGLLILLSPMQTLAIRNMNSNKSLKSTYAFFILSLTSTLAGQISGSLMYLLSVQALFFLPIPQGGWLVLWQGLTALYPIERTVIALGATLILVPLFRILKSSNLVQAVNPASGQKEQSGMTPKV